MLTSQITPVKPIERQDPAMADVQKRAIINHRVISIV